MPLAGPRPHGLCERPVQSGMLDLEAVAEVDARRLSNPWPEGQPLALALHVPAMSDNLQPLQKHGCAGRLATGSPVLQTGVEFEARPRSTGCRARPWTPARPLRRCSGRRSTGCDGGAPRAPPPTRVRASKHRTAWRTAGATWLPRGRRRSAATTVVACAVSPAWPSQLYPRPPRPPRVPLPSASTRPLLHDPTSKSWQLWSLASAASRPGTAGS